MLDALAVEAVGDAEAAQQVDGVLLEQPGPHALLDVLARARLEHDALDALALEQHREREPGGTGPDNAYLGTHGRESIPRAATRITSSVRGP